MLSLNHLISLIYPDLCLVCNENLMKNEDSVCLSCLSKLPHTGYHLQKDNPIEQRFWGKFPVEAATSLYFYKKNTGGQQLLHALKYRGEQRVGELLGRELGSLLCDSEVFSSVDAVVPVPLHVKKFRKRGYNQSESICKGIADVLQKPVDASNLIRLVENPTQTKKGVYERWENTKGIFGLVEPEAFSGRHVLLVDDVLTTGSTLEACAQTILMADNTKISIATLAVA